MNLSITNVTQYLLTNISDYQNVDIQKQLIDLSLWSFIYSLTEHLYDYANLSESMNLTVWKQLVEKINTSVASNSTQFANLTDLLDFINYLPLDFINFTNGTQVPSYNTTKCITVPPELIELIGDYPLSCDFRYHLETQSSSYYSSMNFFSAYLTLDLYNI